jgi:hypothetical protein
MRPFVVVHRDIPRHADQRHELGPVEERHSLAGVEDERNAGLRELRRVRAHAFLAVRRNDAEADVRDVRDAALMRVIHRAGMKRGDLVVVEVW